MQIDQNVSNDDDQMYLNLLATQRQVVTNNAIVPNIPANQAKLSVFCPGICTFMPNRPVIKLSGTRIVAMTVTLPSVTLAWFPWITWSTEI